MEMILLTGVSALLLASVHLCIRYLRFIDGVPRSRFLSFAGGVAVAYVFLHILPELSEHKQTFAQELGVSERQAEAWVYLVAFIGLAAFYGIERAVKLSRKANSNDRVGAELLWLHVASFTLYNMLVGYLLVHREENSVRSLMLYTVSMSLHFVTTDYGMRHDQKEQYDLAGRWMIAGAVLVGWGVGMFTSLPEIAIGFLFAFLAGGIVLNVLKEELPEERQSRFWPFALGGVFYALLLLFSRGVI